MSDSQFLLYQSSQDQPEIIVRLEQDTVWLTQQQMADLFAVTPQNVTQHIRSVYSEGELEEAPTCKHFLQVRSEGGRSVERNLLHYDLDVIISARDRREPRCRVGPRKDAG